LWITVTVGILMYVVPNLTALDYDCVMFYFVDFIYSNRMSQLKYIFNKTLKVCVVKLIEFNTN